MPTSVKGAALIPVPCENEHQSAAPLFNVQSVYCYRVLCTWINKTPSLPSVFPHSNVLYREFYSMLCGNLNGRGIYYKKEGIYASRASQMALVVKNPTANAGDISDTGLIPGLGISLGEGCGNPLQHSCLENPRTQEAGGLQSIVLQTVRHS